MATLSIGIPVFNGEDYLESAVRSVLTQSLHDIEIVISDNASTDKTSEICLRLAALDNRIKYFRQECTISGLENFRFVAETAAGEFFAWLAHDDELSPEFCLVTRQYLLDHPSVVCVSGDYHSIDPNGAIIDDLSLADLRGDIPWEKRIALFFYQTTTSKAYMFIYGMFRRKLLLEVLDQSRMGPILTHVEIPILSRLATHGQLASVPFHLRNYRVHHDSASHGEISATASSGWKGKVFAFWGRTWYKNDQLRVLAKSRLAWRLKLSIMKTVGVHYLSRAGKLIGRRFFPAW